MGVCLRYSKSKDEAVEIANDGFVKVFSSINKFDPNKTFKSWLRRIMINTAIDHYRKNEKYYSNLDISYAQYHTNESSVLDSISAQEIIESIQMLPPSYRIVFNLYVIEGYKHEEIANKLGISEGTSKSNLSIARSKLQKYLVSERKERIGKNG